MSEKPKLPQPQVEPKLKKAPTPLEAQKYQDLALSHPVAAIAVTETERRKKKAEIESKPKDPDFKIRTRNMVKTEW